MKVSKLKNKIVILSLYLIFFLIGDIIFSNFVYKKEVIHNCYKYLETFYYLEKNCYSKEKWIRKVKSYDVYINSEGFRYSGKNKENKDNVAVFLGGSFTYGLGHAYEKTFVGIVERNKKKFDIINLGVPGYSPSVFKYQLTKLLDKKILPKKIFLILDIIDVHNEASRWKGSLNNNTPEMVNKISNLEKNESVDSLKKKNFKGTRIIARYINNFFRSIRLKFSTSENITSKPGYSGWGNFTYMKLSETNEKLWLPYGFEESLKKIELNYKEISTLSKLINSELYIVIYPWSDTLEYGQKYFNWEKFADKLCVITSCNKVINFFPIFSDIKDNNVNWLSDLYIDGDLHLSEMGQSIIANKIINQGF
jgi:hypothetical protein